MSRRLISIAGMFWAWSVVGAIAAFGEESKDVIFSTPYESGRPTTANFYFNDRAIGAGREGFAAIVERVEKLPPGTSVVWGPAYHRSVSRNGSVPNCVPAFLYPDLWKKLITSVHEHNLLISSTYPGPYLVQPGADELDDLPVPLPAEDPKVKQPFDAVFDWEIGEITKYDFKHHFTSAGKALTEFERDLILGRLADNARVLVRITLPKEADVLQDADRTRRLAELIRKQWPRAIGQRLSPGHLTAVVTAPAPLVEALQPKKQQCLAIDWSNYRGPGTPPEETLYFVNGKYIGRGAEGFEYILAEIGKLPSASELVIPRYRYGGRAISSRFSDEELKLMNAELRKAVPFSARLVELAAAIAQQDHTVTFSDRVRLRADSDTVIAWLSRRRDGRPFISFGRIVYYDERPTPAAARLGWTDFKTGREDDARQSEIEAMYTLNDAKIGQGVPGFTSAMDHLAALPEGSIVQVRICLRTKGSFTCPITVAGRRHFERTGFEPYIGMFPWLIDVAQKHKLKIEWIPDEQESCQDCELDK